MFLFFRVLACQAAEEISQAQLEAVRKIRERIVQKALETSQQRQANPYEESIPGTIVKFAMIPIPGGTFMLGSEETERARNSDEGPRRKVSLPAFWIGKCEVTWDEYELFMYAPDLAGSEESDAPDAVSHPTKPYSDPSFGMGIEGYPATSMTHHAASKYCEWLSAKTGHFYRLPTEAEWEYAARAGTNTAYSFGDDPAQLPQYACFQASQYSPVGSHKPNPWGLYDVHGNVAEWTLDQYQPDAYTHLKSGPAPETWVRSTQPYPHVIRGGSWHDPPERLRSAARGASKADWKRDDPGLPKSVWYLTNAPWVGFRIVRPADIPSAEEMYNYWNNGVAMDP
ncbi:MAG: SUMF1/EgtB/PvdO family nonheme iron enzyme [Opitutaceae bacterium]|nr:SUMF1/EgtB/PvdO family nonheme iron enzyme [Opitutaceae bacterium]